MKKSLLFIPIVALLTSCGGSDPALRETSLKIISPTGAPAVSMYNFVKGLETVLKPQEQLIPEFGNDKYDIIVAPAKGGLTKIVKAHANYQMAATVTFGNFALVATGNDQDGVLNAGDNVLFFQPEDIPGAVFNYLYGDLGLNTYSVDAVNLTAGALNTGKIKIAEEDITLDYVFSAEPLITNLNKSTSVVSRASDAFTRKSGGKRIIQAAVFVKKSTDKAKIDEFLSLLQSDISKGIVDANEFVNTFNLFGSTLEQEHMFGVNATTVYNSMKDYNGLGLGYLRAKDAQEEIRYFINDILKSNLDLNEEVYY